MDPVLLQGYVLLFETLSSFVTSLIGRLKASGVSDAQLAALTDEYTARIAQAVAASK